MRTTAKVTDMLDLRTWLPRADNQRLRPRRLLARKRLKTRPPSDDQYQIRGTDRGLWPDIPAHDAVLFAFCVERPVIAHRLGTDNAECSIGSARSCKPLGPGMWALPIEPIERNPG